MFLIVLKWSIDWRKNPPCAPPSLIDVMINLVLKPGTVTEVMYPGQAALQQVRALGLHFGGSTSHPGRHTFVLM